MVEEDFVVSKIKNTAPWTYLIVELNGEKLVGSFYEKELQKISREKFRIEKILKRKADKSYVKWKVYDDSFKSWINKKHLTHWKSFKCAILLYNKEWILF